MGGGREAETTGTCSLKNRPRRTPPEVEILKFLPVIKRMHEIWRMEVKTFTGRDMMNLLTSKPETAASLKRTKMFSQTSSYRSGVLCP